MENLKDEPRLQLNSRAFLQELRKQAREDACFVNNPSWVAAYERLASAADHLDAMCARCEGVPGGRKV